MGFSYRSMYTGVLRSSFIGIWKVSTILKIRVGPTIVSGYRRCRSSCIHVMWSSISIAPLKSETLSIGISANYPHKAYILLRGVGLLEYITCTEATARAPCTIRTQGSQDKTRQDNVLMLIYMHFYLSLSTMNASPSFFTSDMCLCARVLLPSRHLEGRHLKFHNEWMTEWIYTIRFVCAWCMCIIIKGAAIGTNLGGFQWTQSASPYREVKTKINNRQLLVGRGLWWIRNSPS